MARRGNSAGHCRQACCLGLARQSRPPRGTSTTMAELAFCEPCEAGGPLVREGTSPFSDWDGGSAGGKPVRVRGRRAPRKAALPRGMALEASTASCSCGVW